MDYAHISKEGFANFLNLLKYSGQTIEKEVLHLIYLRVSQINGCAYCVDAHFNDLIKAGVDIRKINSLCVWAESIFFNNKERAVLEFAENITTLDCKIDLIEIQKYLNEKEMIDLAFAIANMNAMNRIAITFEKKPKI